MPAGDLPLGPPVLPCRQGARAFPQRRWSRLSSWAREALASSGSWSGPLRAAADTAALVLCAAEVVAWVDVGMTPFSVVAVLTVAALLVRRRCAAVAVLAGPALGGSGLLLAPLVLLFSAGHHQRRPGVLVALVVWTAVTSTALAFWPFRGSIDAQLVLGVGVDSVTGAVMAAGAVAMGRLLRVGQEQAAAMRELVAGRAREQALAEHAARAEERLRLARDMHDVVASQVTVIAAQAGGLRMMAGGDPRVGEVAETIRAAAAQTTRELREVLAALRAPQDDPGPTSPAVGSETPQGLGRVTDLWEASGLPGTLVVEVPHEHALPVRVQRAVYLVVREGLTNAARYAAGAPVRVGVDVVASTVVVSVVNGPVPVAGPGGDPSSGAAEALSTGNGLVGIGERAEELGGHASWGSTAEGGFQLVAVLPLAAAPRP